MYDQVGQPVVQELEWSVLRRESLWSLRTEEGSAIQGKAVRERIDRTTATWVDSACNSPANTDTDLVDL